MVQLWLDFVFNSTKFRSKLKLSFSYCRVCACVREDNPRSLAIIYNIILHQHAFSHCALRDS